MATEHTETFNDAVNQLHSYEYQLSEGRRLIDVLIKAGAKRSQTMNELTVLDVAEEHIKKINRAYTDFKISHGMPACGH